MSTPERLSAAGLRTLLGTYRDLLHQHSARLNRLNVYPVPDGDTGTNMSRTLDAAVDAIADATDGAATDDMAAVCDAIAHGSLMGARGNSGVILSQILRGIATTMKANPVGDASAFAAALRAASDGADRAVLKPIEGTILSVARAAADAAAADAGSSLSQVIDAAHRASVDALERTPEQLPVLAEAGVVDAGGAGFVLLLDAARHVVDGVELPVADQVDEAEHALVGEHFDAVAHRHAEGGELDVSEFRYEVMYLLDLADGRIDEFKSVWGAIGDSIVVVGGDGLWNCHIHTNEIGASIEAVLDLGGRPRQIRVTDLFEEVDEEHAKREAALLDASPTHTSADWGQAGAGLPPVTTAVVAVCVGDGLVELFGQLGVQGVVTGGQTMNPSTQELLDTVEHVNADQVVILPNNSNIIPVAEQVDALTNKRVAVVPTRTMPQALAALVVYDPEATIDAVESGMVEAIAGVRSGEITQAVRDTTTPVGDITTGDWIGLIDREGVVAASAELSSAVVGLLEQVVHDEVELVTVITGSAADTATTELITSWLDDRRADVAVEVQHGGQPLYPYLVGAE
ncbi:MAG: DAK2 domain-containing protein [Actinomycetota bacterium]